MNGSRRPLLLLVLTALGVTAGSAPAPARAEGPPRAPTPAASASSETTSASACPTFRWAEVPGATSYELVLYALPLAPGRAAETGAAPVGEPVLQVRLAPETTTWTPADSWCLTPGRSYAWSVRPRGVAEPSGWSEPALFRVEEATPETRVGRVVASLRELLEEPEAREVLRELLSAAEPEPVAAAPAPTPAPHPFLAEAAPVAQTDVRSNGLAPKGTAGGPVVVGSHFVGTSTQQDFELRVDGTPTLVLEATGGVPNLRGGYDGNSVASGVVGAVIAGGGSDGSFNPHNITDDYGTVGGGRGNVAGNGTLLTNDRPYATVGGGQGNQATGFAATIGGGSLNTASGSTSTIAGGTTALASGSAAAIGGGLNNRAAGARSAVPGGRDAVASAHGQLAYSSGGFDPAEGDAQWSLYVPRATTTDATPTEILLDSFFPLSVAADRTIAFQIQVAARSDAGETAGYEITGVIENVGGTTALVGTPTVTVLGEDDPAWGVTVAADDAADSLSVVATGAAATTIRWVAAVRSAEVAF